MQADCEKYGAPEYIKTNSARFCFEEDENSTLTKVSGRLKRTEYAMKNDHKLRLAGFQETI